MDMPPEKAITKHGRMVEWVECVVLFGKSGINVPVMTTHWYKYASRVTCARSIRNVSEGGTPSAMMAIRKG